MISNSHFSDISNQLTSADLGTVGAGSEQYPQTFIQGDRFDNWDDETIFSRFACGKSRSIANEHFKIEYTHNSLQLSTPTGELVAIHKVSDRMRYILVRKDTPYLEQIQKVIVIYQFVPIDLAAADRRFVRYQKYEIPEGYTLRYEPVSELWQTWQAWQTEQQQSGDGVKLDTLVLAKSKWYRVQNTFCTNDRLDIKTRLGLISLHLRDRIAWIVKLGDIPTINNADLADRQDRLDRGSDSEILDKIISKLALESSPEDGDLQFNPYLTMSGSTIDTIQASSILADRDPSPLTANLVKLPHPLQAAAVEVLENYLEHGETIVTTEVVKDNQGNIVSEKTVTIQWNCPRWAIEAALDWQ